MLEDEIVGQEQLLSQLKRAIDQSRIPHAQLFIDTEGFGGFALALYQAILLLYNSQQLYASVKQGKKLAQLAKHPDLHYVFPTIIQEKNSADTIERLLPNWYSFVENNLYGLTVDWVEWLQSGNKKAQIRVKDIASMQHKMNLKSFMGGAKVCVVWGVECIGIEAANKFLKILEEPPKNTFFMLISKEAKLLPTLVSRCQTHSVPPLSDETLKDFIKRNRWEDSLLEKVGSLGGSLNKLYRMVEESNQNPFESLLVSLLRASFSAKNNKGVVLDLMTWVESMVALEKEKQKGFILYSINMIRDAFLLNYNLRELTSFQSQTDFNINKLAPFVHHLNIKKMVFLFEETHHYLERNASAKMVFTDLCLQLTRLIHIKKESDLENTKKLEE